MSHLDLSIFFSHFLSFLFIFLLFLYLLSFVILKIKYNRDFRIFVNSSFNNSIIDNKKLCLVKKLLTV